MVLTRSVRALLAGSTVRFAPGRLIPALATVVATPVLARFLGPSDFGTLATATAAVLIASALIFGWIEIVSVRELVDEGVELGDFLSEAAVPLTIGVGVVAAATAVALVTAGSPALVLLCGALVLGTGITYVTVGAFRAGQDAVGYGFTNAFALSGRYIFGAPAAVAGAGVLGVLGGWMIGLLLAAAVAMKRLRFRRRAEQLRDVSGRAGFLRATVVISAALMITSLADRLILAWFRADEEVGLYALTYSLVDQTMVLLFGLLMAAKFPQLLRLFGEASAAEALRALRGAIALLLVLVGGLALVLALYSQDLVRLIGGEEFGEPPTVAIVMLTIGLPLFGLSQYAAIPLQHERRSRAWALVVVTMAVVNVVLNFALVPPFGLSGAAAATLVSYGVALLGCLWATRQQAVVYLPVATMLKVLGAIGGIVALVTHTSSGVPWPLEMAAVVGAYGLLMAIARPFPARAPSAIS